MQILVAQNLMQEGQDVEPRMGFLESEDAESFTILFDFDDILVSEGTMSPGSELMDQIRPFAFDIISNLLQIPQCKVVICTKNYVD